MKKRLEWFIVPCVATMFAGNPVSLHAQETAKAKRNLNVVIKQSHEDEAKNVLDKVEKELSNSGISEEVKARILKDVEEALVKTRKITTLKRMNLAEGDAGAVAAKERAMQLLEKVEKANPAGGFKTHFFVDPKNDTYRIGVQCIQSEIVDGEDATEVKEGLEVKAVFEDSPASRAGLKEGDFLLTVDATKINKISDLSNALQEAGKKEQEVTIEAKRDEKVIIVSIKPTKMKSSDIGLEDIRLALPTEGFVLNEDAIKIVKERMEKFDMGDKSGPGTASQVLTFKTESDSLKKDLAELKSEMAEVKKMLKELVGKKSE